MKITNLLENHTNSENPKLKAEHGLSFYIENMGHIIMSDVGQSGYFADNAEMLGIDLSNVEALAISHHHYDHGGGLNRFFAENNQARVYIRQSLGADYVAEDKDKGIRSIGLDQQVLLDNKDQIELVNNTQEVLPGLHLITHIPRKFPKPSGDQRLKIKMGEKIQPDPFDHEMVTVLEQENGLVILTGCAHNGVLNMIEATRELLPGKKILAVVGGFHLHHEEGREIRDIGNVLLEMDIPAVYTGHCTGEDATDALAEILGKRLHRLYTGLVIEF
jgi:7,8-dihydropterin-6-yl-methyl-4-(beta-D-ribofuranosyl)aminobenzene 5'-phosphate synthase